MTVKPSSVLQPVEKLRRDVSAFNRTKEVSAVVHLLIGVHAASDPLLGPVDDPVLPVLSLLGVGLETKHVRSGMSLRNGEANEFLSGKDFGKHFLLQFLRTEVHDGWKTDNQTAHDTCTILLSSDKVRIPETPDHHRNHGRHNGQALEMQSIHGKDQTRRFRIRPPDIVQ